MQPAVENHCVSTYWMCFQDRLDECSWLFFCSPNKNIHTIPELNCLSSALLARPS